MGKRKELLQMALAAALLVGITMAAQAQQDAPGSAPRLPPGKWSVAIGPYMNTGYESLPVRVISVTSEVKGGLRVSKLAVENRSSRKLTELKFTWYLSATEKPEIILLQGETQLFELLAEIQANKIGEVVFPVVSFAKVHGPLLKDGVLNGSYRIQVAVSEVRFDNGSSWTLPRGK